MGKGVSFTGSNVVGGEFDPPVQRVANITRCNILFRVIRMVEILLSPLRTVNRFMLIVRVVCGMTRRGGRIVRGDLWWIRLLTMNLRSRRMLLLICRDMERGRVLVMRCSLSLLLFRSGMRLRLWDLRFIVSRTRYCLGLLIRMEVLSCLSGLVRRRLLLIVFIIMFTRVLSIIMWR